MVAKKYKNKPELVAELREKLLGATTVVITEYRGLKAGDMVKLRSSMRGADIELRVIKNSLLRRATEGTNLATMVEGLAGPTAVAIGKGEPADAAKLLSKSAKDIEKFLLGKGVLDAVAVDAEQIEAIAKLPGKQELRARAVGALQGPLASLVFTLQGVLTQFAGTLQAKIEKEGGAPEAA